MLGHSWFPMLLLLTFPFRSADAVNKGDLVERVAREAGISSAVAETAVDATFAGIAEALAGGERVEIRDFGTFAVKERPARTGRNPQTGATIELPAHRSVTFKPAQALDDAIGAGPGDVFLDVVLVDPGPDRIAVIKVVRAATGLGLKDAKTLVDSAPGAIAERLDRTDAMELGEQIEQAGGTVELRAAH